jgi:hypothetical protein
MRPISLLGMLLIVFGAVVLGVRGAAYLRDGQPVTHVGVESHGSTPGDDRTASTIPLAREPQALTSPAVGIVTLAFGLVLVVATGAGSAGSAGERRATSN